LGNGKEKGRWMFGRWEFESLRMGGFGFEDGRFESGRG